MVRSGDRLPNERLRAARLRKASPSDVGAPMSPQELAEAVNAYLWECYGTGAPTLDARKVGEHENGRYRWPAALVREGYRSVLGVERDADLGFHGGRNRITPNGYTQGELCAGTDPNIAVAAANSDSDEEVTVRRREFLDYAGAIAATGAYQAGGGLCVLAAALFTPHRASSDSPGSSEAAALLQSAKARYQRCQHSAAAVLLAKVLAHLQDSVRPTALNVHANQLAASLLLKAGDTPLALIAADRSVSAARQCDDPLTIAASSRALVHALSRGGNHRLAAQIAKQTAASVSLTASGRTSAGLALTGALLLRGAVAAARCDDRDTALTLLDQATGAAHRLGGDGNEQWTAFGPTNVILHRISVSTILGDAGVAVHLGQSAAASAHIPSVERRANLYLDLARAHTQREHWENATRALCNAERVAPEEVRLRPAVHQLVTDLHRRVPANRRPPVRDLAQRIGAAL
ncbi:hypothetical protein GCM10010123_01570 [Pilimelia anulata]|uniref:Uncharacterized protein n=1 Tax=Pilimelia anulata TaxID=53371 RepID=A0A8J3FAK0_9ACTN|nr:hypothetical protein GCM10010123_01570 [Pilimelia anulata]